MKHEDQGGSFGWGRDALPPPSVLFGAMAVVRDPAASQEKKAFEMEKSVQAIERFAAFDIRRAIETGGAVPSTKKLRTGVTVLRATLALIEGGHFTEALQAQAAHLLPRFANALDPAVKTLRQTMALMRAMLDERAVDPTTDTAAKAIARGIRSAADAPPLDLGSFAKYADDDDSA